MGGSSCVEVARSDDVVLVSVRGFARLTNAVIFEEFCAEMIERRCRFFLIDLSDCKGMDSTFMGILVGLAQTSHENKSTHVCVVNGSDYCRSLLHNLGLERIVRVVDKPIRLPRVEMSPLEDLPCSDEECMAVVQKAHENLVKLDPKNAKALSEFVVALKKEMAGRGHARRS